MPRRHSSRATASKSSPPCRAAEPDCHDTACQPPSRSPGALRPSLRQPPAAGQRALPLPRTAGGRSTAPPARPVHPLPRPPRAPASLRRQGTTPAESGSGFWELLRRLEVPVLPNTAGCHSVQEAVSTAQMARELFDTPWIKLEMIGDYYTLQPDTLNLVAAAEQLIRDGFQVLPYCTEDLVLCQRLVDVGCPGGMPWAAPIGTGRGPANPYAMQILRERLDVTMLVDAGLGRPSHACKVMEWGYDGVLLNPAVALAQDPVAMAAAFAGAVSAGRAAHQAGAMSAQDAAQPSTPVLGTPFWHHAHA